ncbi:MAG: hypothetical protein FWD68_12425 [Alphaproteobacteria bacterium]|nr:hypothetical protein [Alphaproteobacteria bacterium]
MSPGEGEISWWGDIKIGAGGTASERALALIHEKVHLFFVPKLYIFRNIRVPYRAGYYVNSSLFRYFEEMLAELIAQVTVNGFRGIGIGVRFPLANGYMYLLRSGAEPYFAGRKGRGIIIEGAGLMTTVLLSGISFQLWFKEGTLPDAERRSDQ